jgi:hypothetical protein
MAHQLTVEIPFPLLREISDGNGGRDLFFSSGIFT